MSSHMDMSSESGSESSSYTESSSETESDVAEYGPTVEKVVMKSASERGSGPLRGPKPESAIEEVDSAAAKPMSEGKKESINALRNQAKVLGLRGYSRWDRSKLVEQIANAMKSAAPGQVATAAETLDSVLNKYKLADIKKAATEAGIKLTKYSKELGKSRPKNMNMLREELKQHVLNKPEAA